MKLKILTCLVMLCMFIFPSPGKGIPDTDGKTSILNVQYRPDVPSQRTGYQPFRNDTAISGKSKGYAPGSVPEMEESLTQKHSRPGRVFEPVLLLFLGFGLIIIAGFGRRKPPSR